MAQGGLSSRGDDARRERDVLNGWQRRQAGPQLEGPRRNLVRKAISPIGRVCA